MIVHLLIASSYIGSFYCRIDGCTFEGNCLSQLQEHISQEHRYVCTICDLHLGTKSNISFVHNLSTESLIVLL